MLSVYVRVYKIKTKHDKRHLVKLREERNLVHNEKLQVKVKIVQSIPELE